VKDSPVQRVLAAMRDHINDGAKNDEAIDLKAAFEAGRKTWEQCDHDDLVHSTADLVYRHMILEQMDGDAIILVGDEFPSLKQQVAKEIAKRCDWLRDWTESYSKLDENMCEGDMVLCAHNESVTVTSNADIYDAQPGWCNLKIELLSSSSRKRQKDESDQGG